MADITTEINAIRNAVYGNEVRESIASALEAMNDVVGEIEDIEETITETSYADKTEIYKSLRLPNSIKAVTNVGVHTNISELENGEYYALQLVLNNDETSVTLATSTEETGGAVEYFVNDQPLKSGIYLFTFRKTSAVNYIRLKKSNNEAPSAAISLFGVMNNQRIKTNSTAITGALTGICDYMIVKKPLRIGSGAETQYNIYTDISDLIDGHTYVLNVNTTAANGKLLVGLSSAESSGSTNLILMSEQSVVAGDYWFVFKKTYEHKYLRVYDGQHSPDGTVKIYTTKIDRDTTDRLAELYEKKIARRETYLREHQTDDKWYGVEWTEGVAGVSAINSTGDNNLPDPLPIQSKMRRCVVKNGKVMYYLSASNSAYKEDGVTPANLDGTDGDVCVEIPEFFFKFEESTVSSKRHIKLKISEQGLDGYTYSPKYYVGAYEATIDRVNNVLASVCTTNFTAPALVAVKTDSDSYIKNDDGISRGSHYVVSISNYTENATDYRGGNNNDAYDNSTGWHNHLGRPIAELCKDEMEAYTDKRHGKFMYLYNAHRALWILSTVEFKTKNIQSETAGLGMGATVWPTYQAFKDWCAAETESILPCGITNALGNASGTVYFLVNDAPVGDNSTGDVWVPCVSYRGVEHYWGHLYKTLCQLLITSQFVRKDDNEDISNIQYYYQPNPYRRDNTDVEPVAVTDIAAHTREISSYMFGTEGHILPCKANPDGRYISGTDYCDCVEIYTHRDCVYQADVNGSLINLNLPGRNMIVGGFAASGIDVYNDYNGLDKKSVRNSNGTRITYAV